MVSGDFGELEKLKSLKPQALVHHARRVHAAAPHVASDAAQEAEFPLLITNSPKTENQAKLMFIHYWRLK